MQILEVTYRRTVNLGNYNSEELVLKAAPAEGENVDDCIAQMKSKVAAALNLEAVEAPTKPAPSKTVELPKTPTKSEAPAPKVEEAKVEAPAPKVEEAKVEAPAPKVEEAKVEEAKSGRASRRRVGPSSVVYDRTSESHKQAFVKELVGIDPMWQQKFAPKAKEASIALNGKEFLDSNTGKVLPAFVEEMRKIILGA